MTIGKATVLFLGLPALAVGIWTGATGFRGECIASIGGAFVQCGPSLYVYTAVGILAFGVTLFLARLWKE